MVQKIRKKTKGGADALRLVPLVLVVSALAGPRRGGRDVRRPFSPAWRLREIFVDHFDLDVVSTDRPLGLDEYVRWPGAADPVWTMRAAGEHKVVLTKTPQEYDDDSIHAGIVPLLALVAGSRLDDLAALWAADLPEVARVGLTGAFNEAFNLIPGYDRVLFVGPRPARDLNGLIGHLYALVSDECASGGVATPSSFPLCPERVLSAGPVALKR